MHSRRRDKHWGRVLFEINMKQGKEHQGRVGRTHRAGLQLLK